MAKRQITNNSVTWQLDCSASRNWILFIVIFSAVSDICIANRDNETAYLMPDEGNVYDKIFGGEKLSKLRPVPFCYYKHSNESTPGSTELADISWDQYLLMTEREAAIQLRFRIELLQLVDVSEREQTMKLIVKAVKSWYDCRFRWTPKDASIDWIQLMPNFFQTHSIFNPILRTLEALSPTFTDDTANDLIIYRSGLIWLTYEFPIVASCQLDVRLYPFDIQMCSLTFESALEASTLRMIPTMKNASDMVFSEAVLERYVRSDVWAVTILPPKEIRRHVRGADDETTEYLYSSIQYFIILRRLPDYQITNLLIPATMIVVISSCVFLVPPGAGDKMGLSLSILLSLYMFCQLMYDKMPETGTTVPLLSQYFLACIGLVTASCLYSAVSSAIAQACPRVPSFPRRLVSVLGPFLIFDLIQPMKSRAALRKKGKSKKDKPQENEVNSSSCGVEYMPSGLDDEEAEVPDDRSAGEFTGFRIEEPETLTWAAVGALFDRCFFVMHLLCTLTVLTMFVMKGYVPWSGYSSIHDNLTDVDMMHMCKQLSMQGAKFDDLPC